LKKTLKTAAGSGQLLFTKEVYMLNGRNPLPGCSQGYSNERHLSMADAFFVYWRDQNGGRRIRRLVVIKSEKCIKKKTAAF
jgi:hypothetical protein